MSISNLKTYITKIENLEITKVKQYVNYLQNVEHGNHQDRTTILGQNINSEDYLFNSKMKIKKNKIDRKGKGGKPLKVSDKTLTFNIPPNYDCSKEQTLLIQSRLVEYFIKIYGKENYDLGDDYFTNIHYQDNIHVNFIVPYLGRDGKTMRFVKPKKFLQEAAKEFTKIVDDVLNTNIKDYRTKEEETMGELVKDLKNTIIDLLKRGLTEEVELIENISEELILNRDQKGLISMLSEIKNVESITIKELNIIKNKTKSKDNTFRSNTKC